MRIGYARADSCNGVICDDQGYKNRGAVKRQIPLGELARVKVASGPAMIRDEDGLLTGYVFVDVAGRDVSSYVDEASRVVREHVKLPPGYAVLWSGRSDGTRARASHVHHPAQLFI